MEQRINYNVRRKTYKDGTLQYMFYSNAKETNFTETKKKRKKGTGDPEKNKADARKRAIQMVYDIARSNPWTWFITLTFDPEKVNSFDYEECVEHLKRFTQRLQKRHFVYLLVPELHESGRYHFHGLVKGNLPVTPAKSPYGKLLLDDKGRQIYNISIYEYGFTTATAIDDMSKAASYVAKYITKEDCVPPGKKSYWASRGLNLPEVDYLELSKEEYCEIFNSADYQKVTESQWGRFELLEIRGKEGTMADSEVNKIKTISPPG